MSDIYIHPNCRRCDNCESIVFRSEITQFTDEEDQEIYNLCQECIDTIEEDFLEEEGLH